MSDELEAGKEALIALVKRLDLDVQLVIPTRATNDRFLISLTKGKAREFISIAEDDLIDFQTDTTSQREVEESVKEGLAKLGG